MARGSCRVGRVALSVVAQAQRSGRRSRTANLRSSAARVRLCGLPPSTNASRTRKGLLTAPRTRDARRATKPHAGMPSPKSLLVDLTSTPRDASGSPGSSEAASPSGRRRLSSPLDLRRKCQVSSSSPSPSPSHRKHGRQALTRAPSRLLSVQPAADLSQLPSRLGFSQPRT